MSFWRVILWWEAKRPLYTLLLFLFALVGQLVGAVMEQGLLGWQPTDTALRQIVLALVGGNMCFTLGWVVELSATPWLGRDASHVRAMRLYKMGFWFSVFVAMTPTWVALLNVVLTCMGYDVGEAKNP